MFETELGADLRQGDVCHVSDFPRWTIDNSRVNLLQTGKQGLMVESWDKPLEFAEGRRLVSVCSYDCDLENPRARSGILLAPIMKLPASPGSHREREILLSQSVIDGSVSYVSLFPLRITIDGEEVFAVADFSAMATLSSAADAVKELSANRVHEMTDATRSDFQKKLALFTTRGDFATE